MISKKRLTNASKWSNPRYRKLSPKIKLFWFYLLDTCDHAGFWQVDFESVQFFIGDTYSADEVIEAIGDEVIILNESIWFIPSFIPLQYRALNSNNAAHKGVILRLKDEGFDPMNLPKKPKQEKAIDFWNDP